MKDTNKVVVFQVAEGEYAISIDYVISIEKEEGITAVPALPSHVVGIKKVRDELLPIIDLEQVFYNRAMTKNERNRLIVLKTDELTFAVSVCDAKEILVVPEESMKQTAISAYQKTSYFTEVIQLENRLMMVIDPAIFIHSLAGLKEIKDYMKNQPA
ncbi:chemotaxis protein CheW [Niallia sp. 01092]|uniref:chemotaxis protein CheW n=1 Tax=unclassified Niallia TaxID=2837522 RepID=UPI003FD43F6C